jgi:hypothetical protein
MRVAQEHRVVLSHTHLTFTVRVYKQRRKTVEEKLYFAQARETCRSEARGREKRRDLDGISPPEEEDSEVRNVGNVHCCICVS